MVKVCPECEFLNKENAKFCGKCSTDLNGIEAVDERSLPEKPVEKLWVWQDSASIIGFIFNYVWNICFLSDIIASWTCLFDFWLEKSDFKGFIYIWDSTFYIGGINKGCLYSNIL